MRGGAPYASVKALLLSLTALLTDKITFLAIIVVFPDNNRNCLLGIWIHKISHEEITVWSVDNTSSWGGTWSLGELME